MRYRASASGFRKLPYFRDEEFETIAEEALRSTGFMPAVPAPVRIDRFVEERFGIALRYEDLPTGVLGATVFSSKGVAAVLLSRSLAEDDCDPARRRERSTIAHEGGHGLVHAPLLAGEYVEGRLDFLDYSTPATPRVLCRELGYQGPAEYQANHLMGALLLPRHLVMQELASSRSAAGTIGRLKLVADRPSVVQQLAERFDVNPVVARLRLEALIPPGDDAQLCL